MNKNNMTVGIVFIIIGLLGFAGHFFNFSFLHAWNLWPLAVLIPGLCFEVGYFTSRRAPGVLVPGGILTTLGLLFFFEVFTNWHFSEYTWPVYILAPAIGLFQLYVFSKPRNSSLLIPVGILTLVSVISFASMVFGDIWSLIFNNSLVWPILLVVIGLIIIFAKSTTNQDN